MSVLQVCLFGKLSIRLNDRILDCSHSTKVQELFCYLLLRRGRPHPRESLAALFWGDCPTTQSKKYLRQILWQLQFDLNSGLGRCAPRVCVVEPEWVRLNEQADIWLDVAEFEKAFASALGLPSEQLEGEVVQTLRSAVELYQGDLLEGWYQDWCLYERERLQNMFLILLDKLMGYFEAHQEYEAGLDYGARILRYDRARERTHQRIMRLRYLAGDRAGALRQYDRCLSALQEELGVKPSKRTVALYEQIRTDQLEESQEVPPEDHPESRQTPLSLLDLLSHLKELRARLAELQSEVQRDVLAVEKTLRGETRRGAPHRRPSPGRLPAPGLARNS